MSLSLGFFVISTNGRNHISCSLVANSLLGWFEMKKYYPIFKFTEYFFQLSLTLVNVLLIS